MDKKHVLCFELEFKKRFKTFQYNLIYFQVFKAFPILPKIIAMRKTKAFETSLYVHIKNQNKVHFMKANSVN